MIETLKFALSQNTLLTIYIYFLVLVFGLVVGSFLNVVGLRLLAGESIVFPPSKCPKCNTRLKWYDNIPVLAYLFLRGKCRYCKAPISWQYPVVEAFTGIMFLLLFIKFGFSFTTLMLYILVGACISMCITDFREQVIFDWVSMPLIPIGLIFSFFNLASLDGAPVTIWGFSIPWAFISALIGMAIAFLFFEGFSLITRFIMQHRAFGEGDTIIAMVFGAWFGWKAVILTILLGLFMQAVFTIPLLVIKLIKSKDRVASISFATLMLSAVIPVIFNHFDWAYSGLGSILLVFITLGTAGISALVFLRRMREMNSYTLLPFGPALIAGGFIVIFFGEKILSLI